MNEEEVESLLPDIRKALLEAIVQRLVDLRRENGRIQWCTYNSAREYLAAIGVDMSISALYMRVMREGNFDRDEAPPTGEVRITQEDSEISSLSSSLILSDGSKAGRPKGTSDANKKEDELDSTIHSFFDCVGNLFGFVILIIFYRSQRWT